MDTRRKFSRQLNITISIQTFSVKSVQVFYTERKKLKVFRISSDKTSGCSIAEK